MMKLYVITTGILFAVITVAHILRMMQEKNLATDPLYILITLIAAALAIWALFVARRSSLSK